MQLSQDVATALRQLIEHQDLLDAHVDSLTIEVINPCEMILQWTRSDTDIVFGQHIDIKEIHDHFETATPDNIAHYILRSALLPHLGDKGLGTTTNWLD